MNRATVVFCIGLAALGGCSGEPDETAVESAGVAAASLSGVLTQDQTTHQDLPQMVVRRVWGGEGVDLFGSVSYDGRYLSFVDWETGDLAVRDLGTREVRRLTDKGSWVESTASADGSSVSPDGLNVAYTWNTEEGSIELRLVGTDGFGDRTLLRDEAVRYVHPEAWTPNGEQILTQLYRRGDLNQIALISVADGSIRVLKTWDGGFDTSAGSVTISPDGRWVVYDLPADEESGRRDVFLMAADGSLERPLVQHPANDVVLGWTPDSEHVLFASDRTGTLGAWLQEVDDGVPRGDPILVKPDTWRIVPLGFTHDGSFYYGVDSGTRNIYVAALDVEAGAVLAAPVPIGQGSVGEHHWARWSPDGRFLSYRTQKGEVSAGAEASVISINSIETGETREISPKLASFGRPIWSGDGRSLIMEGRDRDGRTGLFEVDIQTGNAVPFENFWGINFAVPFDVSLDGEAIYYTARFSNDPKGIEVRDLDGGNASRLYHGGPQGCALSPDGGYIAFVDFQDGYVSVSVVSSVGGGARELVRFDESGEGFPGTVSWSPDGQHVVYAEHPPGNGQTFDLWFVPVAGGEPQVRLKLEFETEVQGLRNLRFHPDGERVAFDAATGGAEVWVMENFLPGH